MITIVRTWHNVVDHVVDIPTSRLHLACARPVCVCTAFLNQFIIKTRIQGSKLQHCSSLILPGEYVCRKRVLDPFFHSLVDQAAGAHVMSYM